MKKSFKGILCLLLFFINTNLAKSQCSVNAGNDTTICQGAVLIRTAITNTPNPQFQWYYSGNSGNTLSTSSSLNINTSVSGIFTIVVKIDRNGGGGNCPDYDTIQVTINARPNINAGNNISLCQGVTQNISPTFTPSNGSITWTLLGSATVLSNNAIFPIPTSTPGIFNYVVKIDSANTCSDDDTIKVTVNPKPTASFDYSPNSGCPRRRRKLYFNSTSSSNGGGNLNYQWNFGDINSGGNNTSTDNNPEHSFVGLGFNNSGNYTVTLTVTTSSGCTSIATQTISIGTFPDATLIDTVNIIPFSTCNSGTSLDLTVNNFSSTQPTNISYQINWGDLSPNYSSATMTNVTHSYPQQGYYNLTFIVTSGAGCKDSTDYRVFFGSNPGGSISSPSSTYGCTGQTFSFPFANVSTNTPGTEYVIVVNDGTDTVRYTQENLPLAFTHTFDSTSCGTTSNGIPNTFMVTYTISNPCGETPGTIGGIRISKKPKSDFSISPQDTVCVNNTVIFTNTGINGSIVPTSGNGPCVDGKLVWDITPNTGWTLTSGTLGSTNNQTSQNFWTAGSNIIAVNFTVPGVYSIRLRSGGGQCGVGDTTKTICVNPTPIGAFSINNNIGCAPLFTNATNTSNVPNCGQNKYLWSVSYTPTTGCFPDISDYNFINGTNANSTNPQFQFNNPGIYVISLLVISPAAACSSVVVTQTLTVKGKPIVSIPTFNNICQNQNLSPTASASCYLDAASTYAWTFGGGTPATSNSSTPGTVVFNTSGTQNITLAVTNTCGTTTASQSLTVNPVPTVNTVSNQVLCSGATTSAITFTGSTVANTIYNWVNNNPSIGLAANGSGNITSFVVTNTGLTPIVATITVTPTANGCVGNPVSFNITVNPIPTISVNGATICEGESATLTASGADTYTWTPTTGLSAGTGAVVTANPTSTTTYTVTGTITSTGCKKSNTSLVTVNPSPNISSTATTNPTSCASSTGSITLQGLVSGTTYQVQYTGPSGVVNVNITANGSGNVVINNLPAGSYSNITVTLNGCGSNSVGPFSLNDPNPPATPLASNNGPICSGATLNLSASTTSIGTLSWNWTGPGAFNSTSQNPSIANATVLNSGTYSVTVTLNGCTSAAGTTTVIIKETPSTPTAGSNSPVCTGNALTLSANTTSTMPVTWSWTGPSYSSTTQNPTVSSSATTAMSGTYNVTTTATYVIPTFPNLVCTSPTASTVVEVKQTPNISGSLFNNPSNCASSTGNIVLSGLTSSLSYQVQYTGPSGSTTVTLVANAAGEIQINGLTAGNYSNMSVTFNGCVSNLVGPFTLVDPTPPAAPVIAPVAPICSGNTLNLSATTTSAGTAIWSWIGPNGYSSSLSNPSITNAGIEYTGDYTVSVTINGCTSSSTTINVIIKETPATPTAGSNSPVCSGNVLTLSASTTSTMPVTWSWTGPISYSSSLQNPTVSNNATTAMSGTYVVTATATYTTPALVCVSSPSNTTVVVNPTPVITGSSFTDPTNCASATGTIVLNGLANNTAYEVHYTNSSGTAITSTINSNGAGSLTITNLVQGTYSNVYVVLNNCPSTPVGPFDLEDPNPPAAPVATTNAPICAGLTLTLSVTSPITGATYNWTGPGGYSEAGANVSISNTTVTMSGSYNVTVTVNSCTSPATTVPVVINPIPLAPIVTTPVTYCQFATSSPLTATALSGHTLLWYANATGGAGVNIAPTPSTANAGNFSVFVSQVSPEGCEGPRAELVIVVNPTPVLGPQSSIICSGASFNITPTGPTVPSGTTYTWNDPVVTGGLTGGQASIDQNSINGTLSNPSDFVQTATYTVIPKTGNCTGNSFEIIITVNPAPRVNFSVLPQTICSGETTVAVSLSSPTPGVNIPWSANIPTGISGAQSSGTNTISTVTLTNNTSSSLTVVYAAVAITTGTSGCPGDTSRYNIVVNPKPNIPNQSITICSRTSFAFAPTNNPPSTIVPPGTTYTWTVTDNVNVIGESSSTASSDSIRQQLVNLTNQTQTVVYQVIPTSGSAGSCLGPSFSFTVFVEPKAEIPVLYDTICSGSSFVATPVNGQPDATTIVPLGTTYSWNTPAPVAGIGGLASGTAQSNISGTLTNTTFAPITITYHVGTQSGNCPGDSLRVLVTVNPLASISNNPLSQSVCNGGTTNPVNWTSFTAGASYSWTVQSLGVVTGFQPSGSGNTLDAMTLTNPGISQDSVVYLVSSTASACAGPATAYTIYVNPDAKASFNPVKDTACWPFEITSDTLVNNSPQTADSAYLWYVDNVFIGSGYIFPGYTISASDTFVDIKLVTISRYGCVNDSITHRFYTYNDPKPSFALTYSNPPCGPLTVTFQNQTMNFTPNPIAPFNYHWDFGNGQTSTDQNPVPQNYPANPTFNDTTYFVTLTVFNECVSKDTTIAVTVKAPPRARFAPNSTNVCSNALVRFINTSLGIGNTYQWIFGDGSASVTTTSMLPVEHVYNVGTDTTFFAVLIATNECGIDYDTVQIRVTPSSIRLNWYIVAPTQFGCTPHTVQVVNVSRGATQFEWNFNDPNLPGVYTSGLNSEVIFHTYTTPGIYRIDVRALNACTDTTDIDSVRAIRSPIPDLAILNNYSCTNTAVQFNNITDTATRYLWNFGDPTSGVRDTSTLVNPSHFYNTEGVYIVTLTATLNDISGVTCSSSKTDTVRIVKPIAQINAPSTGCVKDSIIFIPVVNSVLGLAPVTDTIWQINGIPYQTSGDNQPNFVHVFTAPGTYNITLIVGTANGCYDTARATITINNIPTITASNNQRICLGNAVQLIANSNAGNYQWTPLSGLSCYTCPNPIANPTTTTSYVVSTMNNFGCKNTDTVLVTVIQPFEITVSADDTLCIGDETTLTVSGGSRYTWSPTSTLSCSTCMNPVANPTITTTYTVVGFDNFNCFTDTAKINIVVGGYPVVNLPPDQILSTGTLFPIASQITYGPIRTYTWTPSQDLSCADCESPVANIKNDICYTLNATNIYGCSGTDTVCIKVFCENGQVFIPNTFTPDNDGINDRFLVRGKGIKSIKHFRVFNRWGEIVFERNDFPPNQPAFGWDGKVRGILSTPDVYVYTAEVVCENDVTFTYKGNVTVIR